MRTICLSAAMVWLALASLCAGELDLSRFSPNAKILLETLHKKFPGSIVPTFVEKGGRFTVNSLRADEGDERSAVYDDASKTIKLTRGADGKIDWKRTVDLAHEFWHAYWDQVASAGEKGGDAETYKLFLATREWLKAQPIKAMTDGKPKADTATWKNLQWNEFTDEYIAALLDTLVTNRDSLQRGVTTGRRTAEQARREWDESFAGKGSYGAALANLVAYRNDGVEALRYQVSGSVAQGVPGLAKRLADLYGLNF